MFRLLCLTIFLYVAAEIGTASWLARYGVEYLSMSLKTAPLLITFFWIGLGITRLIVGVVPIKISDFKLVTICFISAFTFQLLSFIFLNKYAVFISITLLGASLGTVWPTLVSIAGRFFKDKSGSAVGIMVAAGNPSFYRAFFCGKFIPYPLYQTVRWEVGYVDGGG